VESIIPDYTLISSPESSGQSGGDGNCDLPEDYNDQYSKIIFEYNTTNLDAIKKEIQSLPGVMKAEVQEDSNSIIFQMNRAAYLKVNKCNL